MDRHRNEPDDGNPKSWVVVPAMGGQDDERTNSGSPMLTRKQGGGFMLPGEDQVKDVIARELNPELTIGNSLLTACLSILEERPPRKPPAGDGVIAFRAGKALCAKACKIYRSILELAMIGAKHDISILSRSLFETTTAIVFVLHSKVTLGIKDFPDNKLTRDFRALLYTTHHTIRHYRDLLALKNDSRFTKFIDDNIDIDRLRVRAEEAECSIGEFWAKRISKPPKTYSGLTLRDLVTKLDPDLSRWYAVVYVLQSKHVHAVDAVEHVRWDHETNDMQIRWQYEIDNIRDELLSTSALLTKCFIELNDQYDFADSPRDEIDTKTELDIAMALLDELQKKHMRPPGVK